MTPLPHEATATATATKTTTTTTKPITTTNLTKNIYNLSTHSLIDIITSTDDSIRHLSLDQHLQHATIEELLVQCHELDLFYRTCTNLYYKVRALFFLYSIYRFHLPNHHISSSSSKEDDTTTTGTSSTNSIDTVGQIPHIGYQALMERKFEVAIDIFLQAQKEQHGSNDNDNNNVDNIPKMTNEAISSALAKSYYQLGFQTLANQVRTSVRNFNGNQWMFQEETVLKKQLQIHSELLLDVEVEVDSNDSRILCERTPVRMDLSHSGWSDIFFLGMDYPQGARVLNISIDLAIQGKHDIPTPPITTYLQIIDCSSTNEEVGDEGDGTAVLKLTSIDLQTTVTLTTLSEVFDFAKDYLGLLRAGIIASGIIPPCYEGRTDISLSSILQRVTGSPHKGLHLWTHVNDIPKGSRLAVSTNLLGSIIALGMRATSQTEQLTGPLTESERRLVASRAILGEWLGGSGGGWQDSGGIWPGIKLIEGVIAQEGRDIEYGNSHGCLLPTHHQLTKLEAPDTLRTALQESLVLVHGGMAQNVGPVLEMVTEKYLLRSDKEWLARQDALQILNDILLAFQTSNVQSLAELVTRNFFQPIQTIIPWATNLYTETIITRIKERFGTKFWGFWMLGGMSGGGMGFIFHPSAKSSALTELLTIMKQTKQEMEHSLPFAMDPVVYDFQVNEYGTIANWCNVQTVQDLWNTSCQEGVLDGMEDETTTTTKTGLKKAAAPPSRSTSSSSTSSIPQELIYDLLEELGCGDMANHRQVQGDLQRGKIGLAQNRLPLDCSLTNVNKDEHHNVIDTQQRVTEAMKVCGREAVRKGTVGVITLAAGVGSRWTQGAGVVKAIHPFCKLSGKHRTFVEVHIAKSRRVSREIQDYYHHRNHHPNNDKDGTETVANGGSSSNSLSIPHVFTTSYLTDGPLQTYLDRVTNHDYAGPIYQSRGTSIGIRLIPMARDLKFQWEERETQKLDIQAQKVRESLQGALLDWAVSNGEGSDYCDNTVPHQCLHPVGHWYEIPNLLLNGTLQRMLHDRPQLQTLMLHNVDTVGADVDVGLLGLFLDNPDSTLAFEVVPRQIADQGGGLARINGVTRLVEGLALPHGEEDELKLSYYNSMTTWIDIDKLLKTFGLSRQDILRQDAGSTKKVANAVHQLATRLPTYITLKEVKKRWGNGQEDIHPVAQYEKLWSDMSALDDIDCDFFIVPRLRGQQLKDPSELDGWFRDGSAAYVDQICAWE